MNEFTEILWDVLSTDPTLLAELAAIMGKQYPPFLSREQTFRVNIRALQERVTSEVTTWVEWLPDTPINRLGGELALQALCDVDWSVIAGLLREWSGRGEASVSLPGGEMRRSASRPA